MLDEINVLARELDVPIICAGDMFHYWKQPPELLNFAIRNMPENVYAIPGQHDMPNHNLDEMERSALENMQLTKTVHRIYHFPAMNIKPIGVRLFGFPYGCKLQKCLPKAPERIDVAVAHQYVWHGKHKHNKADNKTKLRNLSKLGYDVIVFGDNHDGFTVKQGDTTIVNCGTTMRRRLDERDYEPSVWILHSDKSVKRHPLNIDHDKHLEADIVKQIGEFENPEQAMATLSRELKKLGVSALDFVAALRKHCQTQNVDKEIQHMIRTAMMEDDDGKRRPDNEII
jgi:DNA repair exonuclease SbcCD nuclease subunit